MGLLDEAIREHLELKRRRGGDPSEIAREEREALDPVFPGTAASADAAPEAEAAPVGEPPVMDDPVPDPAPEPAAPARDFSSVGEETAELDMQSVLGHDEMLTEEHRAPAPASPTDGEESGREERGHSSHGPPELDPGQERLSFE